DRRAERGQGAGPGTRSVSHPAARTARAARSLHELDVDAKPGRAQRRPSVYAGERRGDPGPPGPAHRTEGISRRKQALARCAAGLVAPRRPPGPLDAGMGLAKMARSAVSRHEIRRTTDHTDDTDEKEWHG